MKTPHSRHEETGPHASAAQPEEGTRSRVAVDPLAALKAGNSRFAQGAARYLHVDTKLRRYLATHGQHPIATIVACSDSRVPVVHLFDQRIGDLYVIRVAGNIVGTLEAGSIDFAVEYLACPLVVVLGHRHCGAVTAAVKQETHAPSVQRLLARIEPAVQEARREAGDVDIDTLVDVAVEQNVWQGISDLIRSSEFWREKLRSGELTIVGAVYDIESGSVDWIGRHPREAELHG